MTKNSDPETMSSLGREGSKRLKLNEKKIQFQRLPGYHLFLGLAICCHTRKEKVKIEIYFFDFMFLVPLGDSILSETRNSNSQIISEFELRAQRGDRISLCRECNFLGHSVMPVTETESPSGTQREIEIRNNFLISKSLYQMAFC